MSSGETVIAIDSLTKTYRGGLLGNRRIDALRQVSLETRRGEVFGLLGPNGAGKTTLIKILLGVIGASGGSAHMFGLPAGSVAARSRVGYLPESLRIDRHHTARTALKFYGGMSGLDRHTIAHRSPELIRMVGLEGRDRESVRRFSKGMYQRLGLAQALLHDPDLLILDEPTDGLDPVGRSEVRRLLLQLKGRGKSIFLNSHILQEVELVCDRVAIMAGGQIRGIGTIDELTARLGQREVTLELATGGGEQTLRSTVTAAIGEGDAASLQMERLSPDAWRVHFLWRDQPTIDALVDRLRQGSVSILSLATRRRTLEDVFLSLVGSTAVDQEIGQPLVAGLPIADPQGSGERQWEVDSREQSAAEIAAGVGGTGTASTAGAN